MENGHDIRIAGDRSMHEGKDPSARDPLCADDGREDKDSLGLQDREGDTGSELGPNPSRLGHRLPMALTILFYRPVCVT